MAVRGVLILVRDVFLSKSWSGKYIFVQNYSNFGRGLEKFPSNRRLGILIYIPRVVLLHIGGGDDFEKTHFFPLPFKDFL